LSSDIYLKGGFFIRKRNLDDFWNLLIRELADSTIIRNWTSAKGFYGDDFTVKYIPKKVGGKEGYIEVIPEFAETNQEVKKRTFGDIYPYWEGYKSGRIQRSFLVDKRKNPNATRHSKYVISILHQFEYLIYE